MNRITAVVGLALVACWSSASVQGAEACKYRSTVSEHVYDPAEGDPDAGVAPGTRFEDLPADWSDPESGASKEDFEPIDCETSNQTDAGGESGSATESEAMESEEEE